MAVPIDDRTVFEPEALVRIGPPLDDEDVRIPDPIIVVEVLSPSSGRRDSITKFRVYFSLPSVHHCLILDPESATLLHYARQEDGAVLSTALTSGTLRLEGGGRGSFCASESGTQRELVKGRLKPFRDG